MKTKLITALLIVAALFAVSTNQSKAARSNYAQSITVNPIGLAFGLLNATYEQQISKTNSFTINAYYWGIGDWAGYGAGGSYRWYIDLFKTRKRPIEGFSVGPRAQFSTWSWGGYASAYDNGISFSIGGEAVYKWVFGEGFAVEAGIDVLFPITHPDGLSISPFGLIGAIGYAW